MNKQERRDMAMRALDERGVPYELLNDGWLLRITLCDPVLDYSPVRGEYKYYGAKHWKQIRFNALLQLLQTNWKRDNE